MKNFSTKIMALLGVILAGASLASCTPKVPDNGTETDVVAYDGSKVTISLYTTQGQNLYPITDTAIAEFNELYPNITVEHNHDTGGYDDLRDDIKTKISIGEQPNIAYCYADHVALYNKAKVVLPLDDLIASTAKVTNTSGEETIGLSQAQIDDFFPGFYNEGKQFGDGKMYTLPYSKSTEVMYYDKTFFTEHNLKVPTTWDEFETVCAQIKAIDPVSTPLGYDSEANLFITLCEQFGYPYTTAEGTGMDHFLFDNTGTRSFVERIKTWYTNGWFTTQSVYGSYTSGLFTHELTTDNPTRCYMCIGSSAGASHQYPTVESTSTPSKRFEVGIATIPQADPTHPKAISQGPSVCIFKNKDPQKVAASWLLVKFLTTNANYQATFSIKSGYLPPIQSVQEIAAYKAEMAKADGYGNLAQTATKYCIEHADMYFTSPAFIGSSEARTQVGNIITGVLPSKEGTGSKTIDAAFAEALSECQQAVL